MGNESSGSALDRARLGAEAAFLAFTPHLGSGPVPDAFVAQNPSAGIVRAVQELVEADTDAREAGEESVAEPAAESEAAEEADPPAGFTERLDLSWESPFVDYVDSGTGEISSEAESDADADSDIGDGSDR